MSKSDSDTPRGVNFRSAILIAVLVAIPIGVIFRDALPEGVKNFGGKIKKAIQIAFLSPEDEAPNYRPTENRDEERSRLEDEEIIYSEPPLFNPKYLPDEFSMNSEVEAAPLRSSSMPRVAPRSLSHGESPIRQAVYEEKSAQSEGQGLFRQQSDIVTAHGYDSDPAIIPAGHIMGSDLDNAELIMPESDDLEYIHKPKGRYGELEDELKELGATYYRLETWGDRGEYFKFSCYMPNPNEPGNLLKHFQAVEGDDIEAMKKVLQDIRTWKIMEW